MSTTRKSIWFGLVLVLATALGVLMSLPHANAWDYDDCVEVDFQHEDCADVVPPTTPPPTTPPPTETPPTTPPPVSETTPPTDDEDVPPPASPPSTTIVSPIPTHPELPSPDQQGNGQVSETAIHVQRNRHVGLEVAYTGAREVSIALVFLALVVMGAGLLWLGRPKP